MWGGVSEWQLLEKRITHLRNEWPEITTNFSFNSMKFCTLKFKRSNITIAANLTDSNIVQAIIIYPYPPQTTSSYPDSLPATQLLRFMIGIIIIYVIEILFRIDFKRTQPFVSLKSIQWHSIHGKRSPTVPNSCSSLPFSSHGQSEDCMIILSFATNFLWHLIWGFSVRSNIFCKLINLFTSHPLFLLENGFTFVKWNG